MSALTAAANDEDGEIINALRTENEQLRASLLAMHDTLEMTAKAGAFHARAAADLQAAVKRLHAARGRYHTQKRQRKTGSPT